MMRVVLDRQHAGKPPPNDHDEGAVFPDGTTEASHAMRYITVAKPLLEAAGLDVTVLTLGTYPTRNRQANALHAALYVACHVNAGATDPTRVYALTEYAIDRGIPNESKRAAQVLLDVAAADLNERAVGPKMLRQGERGHVCIADCAMPAVIYEPEFTIAARADALVGRSLAEGICRYLGVHWPPTTGRKPTVVHNLVCSLEAPNGGLWHFQADGGVITDAIDPDAGDQQAPYYGSIPEVGGLPSGYVVKGAVAYKGGYAIVTINGADSTVHYYEFPAKP